jgi:hypothetical protein
LVWSIGKNSFLKWWMLAILQISCSFVSPEIVEDGGKTPLVWCKPGWGTLFHQ